MTFLFHPSAFSFPPRAKIRLGVYQPNIKNEREQIYSYSLTVVHPNYDPNTRKNDLMLIKLSYPATINTHVGTIAIAMEPMIFNETCFIPTWTWNSYKNCECLNSSWGGRGWEKMWLKILDRKRKYKVLEPVVITTKTCYSQEITEKYMGQLL